MQQGSISGHTGQRATNPNTIANCGVADSEADSAAAASLASRTAVPDLVSPNLHQGRTELAARYSYTVQLQQCEVELAAQCYSKVSLR